jgi:hypothetical protein
MTKENLPEEKLLKLIRIKRPDKDKQRAQALYKTKRSFELKNVLRLINALLMIAALALMAFLIYRVFFALDSQGRVGSETLLSLKSEPVQQQEASEEKKPFEYYKAQFLKRDLFERPLDQVAANASVDLTKRYKLVGIVLGDVPEAIVEDLTTKKTIFVHQGERLDAVEVKTIEEGRIIFLQEGLEIELKQ